MQSILKIGKRLWFYIILALLAIGCSGSPTVNTQKTTEPTQTLPPPRVYTTRVPEADAAARAYLEGWKSGDYEAMYALLSKESKDSISQADFSQHYQDVAAEAALSGLDYEIISDKPGTASAGVNYKVTLHSSLAGDVQGETHMNLVLEEGR